MTTTINVLRPRQVTAPRAARWAALAFVSLLGWFEALAQSHSVTRVALKRAAEAATVRGYAREIEAQDPRFAADLLAAADRHETRE